MMDVVLLLSSSACKMTTLLRSAFHITRLQRVPFPGTHSSDPYDASSPIHHPHLRPQFSSHPQSTMPGLDMPL
ncbi:hypothetical protein K503DRAFT_776095 [Rhizopogon vinicolor AM-OR11-026]|uniref:Uncharacterized protein n=1 Tax=Rhizopogon vinicolor AM-OR11-026 TaxID=1314800 RepID=A0A1B7MK63_9AGAM|nr:hypothetical protein K503DRAFT_776095 [Rhizopogon vinicolor AM-OR11-026]